MSVHTYTYLKVHLLPLGPGELLVKGDILFKEYWRRLQATAEAFDQNWFGPEPAGSRLGTQQPPKGTLTTGKFLGSHQSTSSRVAATRSVLYSMKMPCSRTLPSLNVQWSALRTRFRIVAAVVACHFDVEEVGHATCQGSCFHCHENGHKWLCPQIWSCHVMALCSDWLV